MTIDELENVILLTNYSYDTALIGISDDNRAIYDFNLMVKWLLDNENFTDKLSAIEWIEKNTIPSLAGENDTPIILYKLEKLSKPSIKRGDVWECPNCKSTLCNAVNYCCECGELIDWSNL